MTNKGSWNWTARRTKRKWKMKQWDHEHEERRMVRTESRSAKANNTTAMMEVRLQLQHSSHIYVRHFPSLKEGSSWLYFALESTNGINAQQISCFMGNRSQVSRPKGRKCKLWPQLIAHYGNRPDSLIIIAFEAWTSEQMLSLYRACVTLVSGILAFMSRTVSTCWFMYLAFWPTLVVL